LVPHVYPHGEAHFPIYSLGARMPRSGFGRALWRRAQRPVVRGLERGRRELNSTRARLGLAPLEHVHGGISRQLALVATFPQLEYPRACSPGVHGVGPLMWEPPARDVEPPAGEEPLVLLAPSTAPAPAHRRLRAALRRRAAARVAWAGAGVRVPRRFVTPRVIGLAVERALGDSDMRSRARELGAWAAAHDAGTAAAELIEALAAGAVPTAASTRDRESAQSQ